MPALCFIFIQLSLKEFCGTSSDIKPEILSATITTVSILSASFSSFLWSQRKKQKYLCLSTAAGWSGISALSDNNRSNQCIKMGVHSHKQKIIPFNKVLILNPSELWKTESLSIVQTLITDWGCLGLRGFSAVASGNLIKQCRITVAVFQKGCSCTHRGRCSVRFGPLY